MGHCDQHFDFLSATQKQSTLSSLYLSDAGLNQESDHSH